MRKTSGSEVKAHGVHGRMVHVRKRLIAVRDEPRVISVLLKGEAIKYGPALLNRPIQTADELVVEERGVEAAGESGKGSSQHDAGLQVLSSTLPAPVEEEFVIENGPAHAQAILFAVKRHWVRAQLCGYLVAAPVKEPLPVKVSRPRPRNHVDRARGGQLGGKVEGGLADLKFLDCAQGDVLCRGADSFVADIETIHLDARSASETAPKGNR